MKLVLLSHEELTATLELGAAYWRRRGFECEPDSLPPDFILHLALAEPVSWWLRPRLIVLDEQQIVGTAAFKSIPDDQCQVEIGYVVTEKYRGQGIATRGVALLLEQGFSHPPLLSISAHVDPINLPSIRVLLKNGFRKTGEITTVEDELVHHYEVRKR
jgi:[ribosomal protein S5]-alanine N-acetyltransferase